MNIYNKYDLKNTINKHSTKLINASSFYQK